MANLAIPPSGVDVILRTFLSAIVVVLSRCFKVDLHVDSMTTLFGRV